jgi:hypothetical protein
MKSSKTMTVFVPLQDGVLHGIIVLFSKHTNIGTRSEAFELLYCVLVGLYPASLAFDN